MLQNRTLPSDTDLTITNVARDQVGLYTCIGSNLYGRDQRQTSISCELSRTLYGNADPGINVFGSLECFVYEELKLFSSGI